MSERSELTVSSNRGPARTEVRGGDAMSRRVSALSVTLACVAGLLVAAPPAAAAPGADHGTTRVSERGARGEPNDGSFTPSVSRDGRWVTFASDASNLVRGDTNHRRDVFVRDTELGTTTRISVSSRGRQANLDSYNPAISDDGRFVVFDSYATNLVPDDLGRRGDVFLHDRETGTTTRVSRGIDGAETDRDSGFAAISGDGTVIAFESSAHNLRAGSPGGVTDIYLVDHAGTVLDWVSTSMLGGEANGGSGDISLSRDGRVVAFASAAGNLVPADTNLVDDVFVRDRRLGLTRRASVNSVGGEGNDDSGVPSLSADGAVVAFTSKASTLTSLDPTTQNVPRFLVNPGGLLDGDDENFVSDVFVHELASGRTELVSVATDGTQGTAESFDASISGDGRLVAFTSFAEDLVPGDTNRSAEVFLRDLTTQQTQRICLGDGDRQGNGASVQPSISADGARVAFSSEASNLVPGDRNRSGDVFVRR